MRLTFTTRSPSSGSPSPPRLRTTVRRRGTTTRYGATSRSQPAQSPSGSARELSVGLPLDHAAMSFRQLSGRQPAPSDRRGSSLHLAAREGIRPLPDEVPPVRHRPSDRRALEAGAVPRQDGHPRSGWLNLWAPELSGARYVLL